MRVLGFSNSSATAAPVQRARGARRGLQLVRARQQREQFVAREFGAGEEVARQAREDSAVMRILTWNLFHGRAVPDCRGRSAARSPAMLAGMGVGRRAAAGGAAVVAAAAGGRVRGAGVHGETSRDRCCRSRARGGTAAGRREVLGRRGERDPRARRARRDAHARLRVRLRPSGGCCRRCVARTACGSANLHASAHDSRVRRRTWSARLLRCAGGRVASPSCSAATEHAAAVDAGVRARGRPRARPRVRPRARRAGEARPEVRTAPCTTLAGVNGASHGRVGTSVGARRPVLETRSLAPDARAAARPQCGPPAGRPRPRRSQLRAAARTRGP